MDAAACARAYATEQAAPAARPPQSALGTLGKQLPPAAAAAVAGGASAVPTDMYALSLLGLLRFFFREQLLELRCESAGCEANAAIAQYHISQLPRTLILHLKRFEMELVQRPAARTTGASSASAAAAAPAAFLRPLKRPNTVYFPPTLSLAPFCTPVVRLPPPLDLRACADVDADLLDDADHLVPHRATPFGRGHRVVRMQVAAAHARDDGAEDRVGGLFDPGLGGVDHADVTGTVHIRSSHP
jgi:hypothetical protein